jgi:primary-amine oxidase
MGSSIGDHLLAVGGRMKSRSGALTPAVVHSLLAGIFGVVTLAQSAPTHPLEPLSKREILDAVALVKQQEQFGPASRFVLIQLKEPPKPEVLAYRPGAKFTRRAFVIVYDYSTNLTNEAVVDLREKKLVSWKNIVEVQPGGLLDDDDERTEKIVKAYAPWQEAMRRRRISDFSNLTVFAGPAGPFTPPRDGARYVVALTIYKQTREHPSFEEVSPGVRALVNLTKGEVADFEDTGLAVSMADPANVYDSHRLPPARPGIKRVQVSQPTGKSFQVLGHAVHWQNWRFRFGMDPRLGLVLYMVNYEDKGKLRPILYRASLSELIVPYGDPGWHPWAPFDAGEAGLGNYGVGPLRSLADAPENAVYFTWVRHEPSGKPLVTPRAIALYERDGGVLWRHVEWKGSHESRQAQQLVLSWFATMGNYDYGFEWIFSQDGSLEMQVLLTGLMTYRMTNIATEAHNTDEQQAHYSHLVAPNIEAPNHQHFFNFRLDFDIDGPENNSVLEMNTEAAPPNANQPNVLAFGMKETLLRREQDAQRVVNMSSSRKWKVTNSSVRNSLGQPSAYLLVPGENSVPYAPPDSYLRRNAGFVNAHVWVTPYDPEQMYAAGDYVKSALPGDGLPKWITADRSIENRDIVVWYTMGITHAPRVEDWPVMPVHRAGFQLIPAGFFSRNPGLDVHAPVPNAR